MFWVFTANMFYCRVFLTIFWKFSKSIFNLMQNAIDFWNECIFIVIRQHPRYYLCLAVTASIASIIYKTFFKGRMTKNNDTPHGIWMIHVKVSNKYKKLTIEGIRLIYRSTLRRFFSGLGLLNQNCSVVFCVGRCISGKISHLLV